MIAPNPVFSFADEVQIEVLSGKGGDGAVSFRREKYVPRGGPDGGDGGDGGDAVFIVRSNLRTLSHLKQKNLYRAADGAPGGPRQRHGKRGADVLIPVPPGTMIRDTETGEILKDLKSDGERWVFLQGGRGGKGNRNFATSTRQAPRFAKPGAPGEARRIVAELNLIADVGLVGLPNAGKSTLISRLTHARPKIAGYPFTTKTPHLGILSFYDREIVLADIPGIIEGASSGAGMGLAFLKHISRTRLLALVVDLTDEDFLHAPRKLLHELESYGHELVEKRRLLLGNKIDAADRERVGLLGEQYPQEQLLGISALTGEGLDGVVEAISGLLAPGEEG